MCGNKIQRDIFGCAMFDECIHPRRLCGCRTSHAKPSIYFFDRVGSVIVKLPISILFRLTRPEIDVGLIPDFEIPFGNFIGAISLNQMPGKSRNKLVPFVPTFGGETFGLYQKGCRASFAANCLGMKLSSTNGFTPLASKPS